MPTESRKLYAFVHTHWDREWYQPFETFRAQLLDLVRTLLPLLSEGKLPRFYLDGQSIIFEDVLAIEPQLAPLIRALMEQGKLSAGPWYVLPDEMLVSGESLIRNLAHGLAVTRQFGDPALVGYCPDTFGHSQDLPNILAGFGINNAIVWRGVPLLEMGPLFWWNSPDGSRVMAYHLTRGYYQTGFHELEAIAKDPDAISNFARSLKDWVGLSSGTAGGASPFSKPIDGALMPIGADHVAPPASLQALIDRVNEAAQKEKINLQIVPTTLPDFMRLIDKRIKSGINLIQAIDGELRFNRSAPFYERAYLLPGVLSTRLYLKRANRLSEYRLSRLFEPLNAIASTLLGQEPATSETDHAWKLLLQNHPHDSICGCSVDAVHDEMLGRTGKLNDLLDALFQRIEADLFLRPAADKRSHLDPELKPGRFSVFNVSASALSAPVYMRWYEPLESTRFDDASANVQIERKQLVDQLFSGWGAVPYYKEVLAYEGWVWAEDLPALGYRSYPWMPPATINREHPAVTVAANKITNGPLSITVSASGRMTATCKLGGQPTQTYRLDHIIRDVGDGGDTYNFDPIPNDRPIEAKVTSVKVGKRGPLVGSLIVTYEIDLPESATLDGNFLRRNDPEAANLQLLKRSRNKIKHEISVEITLKRGIPILFFDATWENKSTDHRLEVVFETGTPVESTYSENHLSIARRFHNLRSAKEKLPVATAHEANPDRFPSQRFVATNGQVFLNTGLPEYAVEGSRISLTMLRAVSQLSKPRLWTRGGGAGPSLNVPGANCLGLNQCSYGWAPLLPPYSDVTATGGGDKWVPEAYRLAELYEGATWGALGRGRLSTNDGIDASSLLHLDNPSIRVIAFYSNEKRGLTVRLLNVRNEEQVAKLHLNCKVLKAEITNYAGKTSEPLTFTSAEGCHSTTLSLTPYQVMTLHFKVRSV